MSLEINRATPSDAEALASILQEANNFKHTQGDRIWGRYDFTLPETLELIEEGHTYVATVDGDPAGCVRLLWSDERIWGENLGNDNKAGYVNRLATKDSFRAQGIGAQIVSWTAEQVQTAGKEYLRLDCSTSNEGLCAYYRKLGFTVVDKLLLPNYDPTLFQRPV